MEDEWDVPEVRSLVGALDSLEALALFLTVERDDAEPVRQAVVNEVSRMRSSLNEARTGGSPPSRTQRSILREVAGNVLLLSNLMDETSAVNGQTQLRAFEPHLRQIRVNASALEGIMRGR
jgi:hypothetical protein